MSATVIEGDCVEILRSMTPESIDLVVADPPYNIGIDYGRGAKEDLRFDYDLWCERWIESCYRVLRPAGSIWIISGQEHGAEIDLAMRDAGFVMRNRVTWHETFGVYCHNKFGRTSRPIFYAWKPNGKPTFNREAVLTPSARAEKYGDRRAGPDGMKIMGDVWQISRVCGTFGERIPGVPTQLPEALVQRIVEVSSNRGDTILDPFAGSGTTLAVSERLGRNSIGIELNPDYVALAKERIACVAASTL